MISFVSRCVTPWRCGLPEAVTTNRSPLPPAWQPISTVQAGTATGAANPPAKEVA